MQLSWTAATDNVGVAGYAVSCALGDGPFFTVARCALPAFVARPSEDGTCRYRVLALDFQENMSAWSDTVTVKVATP